MAHSLREQTPPRSDNDVHEYAPSLAERKIKSKKYGAEVGYVKDPFRMRFIGYESGFEDKVVHFFTAQPTTVDLREQVRARFRWGTSTSMHWLDFVRTRADGLRIAYAVKYADAVDDELRAVLDAIAAYEGDSIADEYRILKETDLDAVSIENARLVCECARDHDRHALEAVRAVLPGYGERMTFGEIAENSGFGWRGYRAAVALVQSGLVEAERGTAIGPDTVAIGKTRAMQHKGFTR